MKMQNLLIFVFVTATASCLIQGAPIVQKVTNNSQIGFLVLFHNDSSSCSLHTKNDTIDAHGAFEDEFLLVRDNPKQPSLILRPAYYLDSFTGEKLGLLDDKNEFDMKKVQEAYQAWKTSGKKRQFKNAQDWLSLWVGKDIIVVPDSRVVSGYLVNLSRAHIGNSIKEHGQWLSYAKGVFSRLMVEIDIEQHDRRGIRPIVKVVAGQGGICTNGIVERV